MEMGFSLGSNLGNRMRYLKDARDGLRVRLAAERLEQSVVYETAPVGVDAEYAELAFLNAVVVVATECDCREALRACREIEQEAGRERTGSNSPRTLDVDIIYADGAVIEDEDLVIPHPRWKERRFVLRPLADVRPDVVLPGAQDRVAKLLENHTGNDKVELFAEDW